MITVDVFELENGRGVPVGSISWDGRRYLVSDPADPVLTGVLAPDESVWDAARGVAVTSRDPVAFLTALHFRSGSHVWYSRAQVG